MNKTIIITGGCGFVGHHFVEHFLKNSDFNIIVIDKLGDSSAGFDRLRDIDAYDDSRVKVLSHDLQIHAGRGIIQECEKADWFLHLAAESHVDRSIVDPLTFIKANVLGTHFAADLATRTQVKKFLYFSTDEIFGPAAPGEIHAEYDTYNSTNPYAATKAAGEELINSYINCYKFPAIITHTMNIYGERQHPEKFVPLCVRAAMDGTPIVLHSDPEKKKTASRFWLHARNAAHCTHFLMENGEVGQKYNVVGEQEVDVETIYTEVCRILGAETNYIKTDYHSSRPGHDMRYALSGARVAGMGYSFPFTFGDSFEKTVRWMTQEENKRWMNA